jgi:hypothetical protein
VPDGAEVMRVIGASSVVFLVAVLAA